MNKSKKQEEKKERSIEEETKATRNRTAMKGETEGEGTHKESEVREKERKIKAAQNR